jgi:hypothetical protein
MYGNFQGIGEAVVIRKALTEIDWATLGVPKLPDWLEGTVSHDFDNREEANNAF